MPKRDRPAPSKKHEKSGPPPKKQYKPEKQKPAAPPPSSSKQATADDGSSSRGQQQRQQRIERQKQQPTGELKLVARKQWEELRRGDLDPAVRKTKMAAMMTLIQGRIKEITFKHDMSRVVQTCLKYGDADQRSVIAEELNGSYVDLSRSTYGRHILVRMLKYCPKQRPDIIQSFYGNVRKLVRHKDAASVLEECYAVYANAAQRWDLVAEFYGNEFAVFKESNMQSLETVLEKHPLKRATILSALKATVTPLLEKGTVQYSIVHRALLDYMKHADPKDRQEVIEAMRELVVEVLHTRDGAHAGMLCLLYGSPKDRKAIVKSMKPFLRKICCEEYGYAVLIEALDCVDDTVFMNKSVLQDIGDMVGDLLANQYGRRVPLYVLSGRNPLYVGSDALKVLRSGDSVRAETSKKDPEMRYRELRTHISPKMVEWVAANAGTAVFEPFLSQAVSETLLHAEGDRTLAWAAVRDLIADSEYLKVLTDPVANRVVTNCIKASDAYAQDVLETLVSSDGWLEAAACAGAFPVRALLESPATGERTKALLAGSSASIRQAMDGVEKKRTFEAILGCL
ncbi:Pumilio y domain member 6 [Coemansia sp. RSA 1813]|nr:Pumilio y domain member 6 [Coemansia sp. RSA 1843]KAJ2085713.1 Pumilio y domain member 6 [Coemansia sp. RSA 986]KAJ2210602.1 Pumilio y domain member 6 [Coemansia sp. RSA 487]KAJ2563281.1 Pumilio y domain member 6 [Coemansia sp. RSA 1813]